MMDEEMAEAVSFFISVSKRMEIIWKKYDKRLIGKEKLE